MEDLLKHLIRAESTVDKGEEAAAEVVARCFAEYGIDCRIDRWGSRHANLVARVKTARKRPGLLFVCHLDVVGAGDEPWVYPAFEAFEVNGRVYGRGAADMKGGIAAAATAICEVVDSGEALHGDVVFAATAGEETDSAGVRRFMQRGGRLPRPAGVVIPEPTDLSVVTAHRGMLWLKITTGGRAVHSSMAERGVNAITSMRRVLDALEQYRIPAEPHPLLGHSSVSVNTIAGGEAMNIVPDRCTVGVDIRTLPGQDHEALRCDIEYQLAGLRGTVPQLDYDLVVDRSVAAMETDPDCQFVKTFCHAVGVDLTNAVGFTTDAPHLAALGAPVVVYGPGKPKLCHQVDEFIDLADVRTAADHFKQVILEFLT